MSRLFVGPGAAERTGSWLKGFSPSKRVIMVSELRAWRAHGLPIARKVRAKGYKVSTFLLPSGERAKNWDAVSRLLGAMLKADLGRDSGLIAIGGGAVTDSAGFAAAVFLRGIPWISIPTTLMGQLDSGIGGKTAINLPEGKNLAGAFHQPQSIICDTRFLATLPPRELVSGLAEGIKYGLLFEPALYRFIRSKWGELVKGDAKALERVIRKSAAWKVKIVKLDERETKGRREFLNLGHTLGHALEKVCGFGRLRHGEAVLWGMRAALRLSIRGAGLSPREGIEADDFLASIPLPSLGAIPPQRILGACRKDKKIRGGKLRFVLLRSLGRPVVKSGIDDAEILRTIEALL